MTGSDFRQQIGGLTDEIVNGEKKEVIRNT
jgi:hypothetical protein